MPSKLRKAIGAVKDQTSISLAKVTNAANLEVIILKATTHDKNPIEERYVNEIVNIVSSNKAYAAACAQCIGKRIGKTRNWVVALKSLMIVLRIFQDGDPYFPREVFHAMKRGAKILNLSSFKDDSNSSPWDYTAFIRTFALYLDERLDCFLTGKLQRRFNYQNRFQEKTQRNKLSNEPGIRDMKPTMVLARITYWQKLLDRAIGTRPTGSAKNNRLVQISLYAIVQESFDLYKDISDGLAVVLDNFFTLPLSACVTAFNACVKSYKQFDELSGFYSFCANIGVGRSYEYPTIQKVSEELMETLQAFLKDQASFPTIHNGSSNSNSKHFNVPTPKDFVAGSSSYQDEGISRCSTLERLFETGSEFGSQCTSLEDLMSAMSPVGSPEQDSSSVEESDDDDDDDDKQTQSDDFASANGSGSSRSLTVDQTSRSSLEITTFDDLQHDVQTNECEQQNTKGGCSNNDSSKDCWELVLAKTVTASTESSPTLANGNDPFVNLFDQALVLQDKYNPFLEDTETTLALPSTTNVDSFNDVFDLSLSPTFNANDTTVAPTFFNAQDPLASTFTNQNSNSMTDLDLLFGDINANDTIIAPTFRAQDSLETNMTLALPPTFHTQASDNMIIVAPSFQSQSSFKNSSTSTIQVYNSIEVPNHNFQNFDTSIVPFHFQSENFYNSAVAPTFSATDYNELTLAAPIEDDPFGPWPSAVSNDQMSNVSMQEQNLLRQQQLWLEQQNKIIAKYIG